MYKETERIALVLEFVLISTLTILSHILVKVSSSLIKCAQLKRGVGLREGDSVAVKEVKDFLMLHNREYTEKMALATHASYHIKGNKHSV